MNKPIYKEIHFIRAIACLMVVMVHVTSKIYSEDNGFPDSFSLILNQFSRLGTPIFAVLSAFLLFSSVKNRGFKLKKFILSRTTKIAVPFIIWTIIYSVYSILYLGWDLPDSPLVYLFLNFVLGDAYYHLYFIVTIIQFYFIFPLLQMIRNKVVLLTLFFVSLPINYIFLGMDNSSVLDKFGAIGYIINHQSFVLNWISYFLFGAVLANYYIEIRIFCKKNIFIMCGLIVVIICGVSIEIDPNFIFGSSRPANLIYIPTFVICLLAGYQFVNKAFVSTINLIGKYSMGIYLIHPLVIVLVEKILPSNFWLPQLILITYILTVVLTMLLVRIILLLPKSNYIISVPLSINKEINKNVSTMNETFSMEGRR